MNSTHADRGYILAIDLGTSGPKAALIDTMGEVVAHEFESTRTFLLPDGGVEEDPNEWWDTIIRIAKRLLKKSGIPGEKILGISSTSQWSCTVAVADNGKPLMNAISWMDARGAESVAELTDGPLKIEGYDIRKLYRWISRTGGAPAKAGRDPLSHILYIKNKHPDIYRQTFKFLEARDYLNLCLTGRYCTSPDCITLHWVTDNRDINNVRYDDGLVGMSGIDRAKFPEILPAAGIIGPLKPEVAATLGLDPSTPVIIGSPDLHSAAIGAGATRDFEGHLYIGTSSWLLCHVPDKKTDLFHKMASFPSAIPGKYLLVNEQEIAGEALNILKHNLGFGREENTGEKTDIHSKFNDMAREVPPASHGVIFTPWLNGERAPVDDHHTRGGFYNLGLQTTQADMVRAVFEGVACNSRWLLKYVEKFIKKPMDTINIIGGGARSDLWCQIHADVLNRTIRRVKHPVHSNVRGAGLIALVALGILTFDQIPHKTKYDRIFTPDPDNRAVYDKLFEQFVDVYHVNRKFYKKLNG